MPSWKWRSRNSHQARSIIGSASVTISQSNTATTLPVSSNIWLLMRASPHARARCCAPVGLLAFTQSSAASAIGCGRPCAAHSNDRS
jgi:hypothetical protein